MNRRQKLVQQQFLNNERAVISRLQYIYDSSLTEINKKIHDLEFKIDDLTEVYDWMDDDDPEKEKIRSKIQSKIYQKQYQEQLQGQLEGILKQMQTKQYLTISDYLNECYEDGFVGALFDQHGQGVPLMMPLNQEAMVNAVQLESKISQGLYTRLGEDLATLKKRIAAEITRGIATGAGWKQTARQLAGQTRIGYNRAVRITRTEGHRVQNTATMNAAYDAKERGADLVKQWDATLDGKTRESHVAVDGEIRELDESFSNGLDYPGDPAGGAAEVVNCRCAMLQRARWAVEGSFTKWNNFTKQLETFDSPESYDEFKKGFFSDENKRYMNYVQQMEKKYGTRDFEKILDRMNTREYNHYSTLLTNNPVYNKNALENSVKSGIMDLQLFASKEKQYGKKIGKHAEDFGLDASNPEHRQIVMDMIDDVTENYDVIKTCEWRGQADEVDLYIKGKTVVIRKKDGEFITIMGDALKNERVKNARIKKIR